MNYDKNIFYAPNVILHFTTKAEKQHTLEAFLTSDDLKQIQEAKSVAIMLFAMNIHTKAKYWMQLVDPKDKTPDIRTIRRFGNGEPESRAQQAVEVVTLEKHSEENIPDFILRTKLSAKKWYPDNMNILCALDRYEEYSFRNIHNGLKSSTKPYPVFVLGRISQDGGHQYAFSQVHPTLNFYTEFDAAVETRKNYDQPVIKLIRGNMPKKPLPQGEIKNPFFN